MKIAVHVTHEAVQKIGGIGSVINGFCTADNYSTFFDKSILYGPQFFYETNTFSRLGKGGTVLYSSYDNFDSINMHDKLVNIEKKYGIELVYGKRMLVNEFNINKQTDIDVILVGIQNMNAEEINIFKFMLWEQYQLQCNKYTEWDFEQYLRIGIPYSEILEAIYGTMHYWYHFSHEYMGVPSLLSIIRNKNRDHHKTIFWAHEISPARMVVENIPGHDVAFYSIMNYSMNENIKMEHDFPQINDSYRTQLLLRTDKCNYIFAVSDLVKMEYEYVFGKKDEERVKVVYNGISGRHITFEEKQDSRRKLIQYCDNLYNFTPDIIFTHVTRLVVSKGLWRDLMLLHYMDELFDAYKIKGFFILLSSLIGSGRNPSDIEDMEQKYGWPVLHQELWPDCIGYEVDINRFVQIFNAKSKAIKALFVNQFGFDRRSCGKRMPETMSFQDLRQGTDVELGMSIYEPFGIAQLESLPYGSSAVLSSSCGCSCFLKTIYKEKNFQPFTIVDFIDMKKTKEERRDYTMEKRDAYEHIVMKSVSASIFSLLPKTDNERLIYLEQIQEILPQFLWEAQINRLNLSTL